MQITRLRVGLSIRLIYSLMGRCHKWLFPCHYSEQRSRLSGQLGGEDVWTVKMSKEKVGGQGADLWPIPSILGAPLGLTQYICLRFAFTFRKQLSTPLTQDHHGDLWHGYTCIYTLTRLLLSSLHTRDKLATPRERQREEWEEWWRQGWTRWHNNERL